MIIWKMLARTFPSKVREIIIDYGEIHKGRRPALNVGSVMFTCALWTITLKLITGKELGGYSFHLFFLS